ncbi:MAG: cobyrinic acid a,c-diamide synthase [Methanoregula sp.]|nr:cobyrinic acid a,c-diamide synthase [Methanoregula sp.]
MKIAVAGKGGTGKTFIAGTLAWQLSRDGYTTLAIDADSAPNLGISLGLGENEAGSIVPVSKNEDLIRAKTGTGYPGVYNLNFSVDEVVKKFSAPTPAGVSLLVMGTVTSMGAGCTCPANSVVRALLRHLIIERDEAVILDMEAGVEHLGRGTAEGVNVMLVISDANKKSLAIAGTIARMAQEAGIPRVMLVGNRGKDPHEENAIRRFAEEHTIPLLGFVPFDPAVAQAGISGTPVMDLTDTPAVLAVRDLVRQLENDFGKQQTQPDGCEPV